MADVHVDDISIGDLLQRLGTGEWQVPVFQRDFVWSTADVESLLGSIFQARPIGMVTLWEQADNSGLQLDNISLPDSTPSGVVKFERDGSTPVVRNAILDGRQRCTAIAMAFGGLRPANTQRRHAGRFFLSLLDEDLITRVKFKKPAEIVRENLESLTGALAQGFVPLELTDGDLMGQWLGYVEKLREPEIYPDGILPDDSTLERRREVLWNSFKGINGTKLAVYTVPAAYDLGDICEIFETLNTKGTRVSVVDLVHSWLYAASTGDDGALLLRDWINDLGGTDGAVGWATKDSRPELTLQFVTACHVASSDPPDPRPIGGKTKTITSVKSDDLLGTPTEWWRLLMDEGNTQLLGQFCGDMQLAVAGGRFPASYAPYPASFAIYVALRWFHHHENPTWTVGQLDSAFRAFYWQNALTTRYDQGFLTQIGADIKSFKATLNDAAELGDQNEWMELVSEKIKGIINRPLPDRKYLLAQLTDGSVKGAIRNALRLRMRAQARQDLLDPQVDISFPSGTEPELHHVFPKAWCNNNKVGDLKKRLDELKDSGRDWLGSAVNLIPLSKDSNLDWRAKRPEQILKSKSISYSNRSVACSAIFIDEPTFDTLLEADANTAGTFWDLRADLMADDFMYLMTVQAPGQDS